MAALTTTGPLDAVVAAGVVVVAAGEGVSGVLLNHAYPVHDESLTVDREIELPVMAGGKVRARITVDADADVKSIEAAALAHEDVVKFLAGKAPKKVIVVPGKMVNLVV